MNTLTRRRFLLGGSLPTEGVRGTITLTESQNSIVLDNPFGTTDIMFEVWQTEGWHEDVASSAEWMYNAENMLPSVVPRFRVLTTRNGWTAYGAETSETIRPTITESQITLKSTGWQPALAGTYEYIIVKL